MWVNQKERRDHVNITIGSHSRQDKVGMEKGGLAFSKRAGFKKEEKCKRSM